MPGFPSHPSACALPVDRAAAGAAGEDPWPTNRCTGLRRSASYCHLGRGGADEMPAALEARALGRLRAAVLPAGRPAP